MNRKNVFHDVLLNIIASAVPICVLHLFIYPSIAEKIGGEANGFMLTIYSVWTVISASLGNILNNTRLLLDAEYRARKIEGDFSIVFILLNIINAVAVFVMTFVYYKTFDVLHIFLSVLISFFILAKGYLEVEFRIRLNYKDVLISQFILAAGFVMGFGLFCIRGIWEFVFLAGYAASAIYCALRTKLLREPRRKTELMPKVTNYVFSLGFSSIAGNIVAYADKMVLYSLMGGYVVSVYFAATILGKMVAMLISPMTSVMLSYISKWDKSKMRIAVKAILIGAVCSFLGYFMVLVISRPVIGFLYPQWIDEVAAILPITTATMMLNILVGITHPFVLKFCNINWQMAISAAAAAVYFLSALILWHFFGLTGFCIGTVIGKAVHLVIMLALYFSKYKKNGPARNRSR